MSSSGAPGDLPTDRTRLLADVVEQVKDYAIIALDLQGTIVSWNAGAEAVKGYPSHQAVGRSFAMFYTDEDRRNGLPSALLHEASEAGICHHQGWRVRRDGTRFWADVTITALHDDAGRPSGYAKVTRDMTAQHALEVRLSESEERLRLLVGQVVDYAIIALDPQGTIETWNLGAERLKGYTAEEAIGCSFAMFYASSDQREGLPAHLLQTARDRGRAQHTGWRVRRDGTRFWADVTITALHDTTGRVTGFAKVTRDRTDVKRLEEAQDAFYANFSHDFRTPITVMKGFVDALRDAEAEPELRSHLLDRIEAGADRLASMVKGLVDFAQQRVEQADVPIADLDLASLARSVVAQLASVTAGHRVTVDDAVALTRANGEAMERVVSNLVVNAVKYSPDGSDVALRLRRVGDQTELRVVDHGRGIHADDLSRIFDQFERGRLAVDDGGSGLGLASARDLVERQGGTITVTSTLGVGTEVTVSLPASLATVPTGATGLADEVSETSTHAGQDTASPPRQPV